MLLEPNPSYSRRRSREGRSLVPPQIVSFDGSALGRYDSYTDKNGMAPPNMRLKLAGAPQVRKNCVASPPTLRSTSVSLRSRAFRPQLKRDPLGGCEKKS